MRKRGEMKGSGSKVDRKTVEKNRRIQMKYLCFKLVSHIPSHHFNPPKEFLSQQDQIGQAADYIQKLSRRVEELRRKKAQALTIVSKDITENGPPISSRSELLPVLKLRYFGSSLEVVVISGLRKNFKLHQVIRVLEEQGAEVVTCSLSTVRDKIFHILHAQVKVARVGVDTSTILGRLEELI